VRNGVAIMDKELEIVEPNIRRHGGGNNRFPDELREAAVERAFAVGVRKAAKELGIAERTIFFLIKELGAEHRELWNEKTSRKLEKKIEAVLEQIGEDKISKAGLKDLAIALGVLADKREQFTKSRMKGEATARLRIAWRGGEGAVELTGK